MTLATGIWAVDGQMTQAVVARLQLQSATRSGNGVVEATDLTVRPLTVPGTGVVVGDGAAVVLGREASKQGSYWVPNVGDETVTLTATTSSGPRSDMVYLRVEDPTVDGTPWTWNPASDQLAYFRVWEGCPSTAVDVPAGETGVPLARITRPASTGTVEATHITSLRKMANPRSLVQVFTKQGSWATNADFTDAVGGKITWSPWPHDASFSVDVPPWASVAKLSYTWGQVQYIQGGNGTGLNGSARILFGTVATNPERLQLPGGTTANPTTPPWSRQSVVGGDTISIPAALRGTTVSMVMQGIANDDDGNGTRDTQGLLQCDGGSSLYVQVVFEEVATTS